MGDIVVLNVGGSTFETRFDTLKRYPETKLARLQTSSDTYISSKGCYFFDRNPFVFGYILDLYRNGELHLPSDICGAILQKELEFWQISPSLISRCCLQAFFKHENDVDIFEKLESNFTVYQLDYDDTSEGNWMRKIWLIMDQPRSSKIAKIYNMVFLLVTMISVLIFCFESHPAFQIQWLEYEGLLYLKNTTNLFDYVDVENPKLVQLATMYLIGSLYIVNVCCLSFFTLDLIVHLIFCPKKLQFFRFGLNILDVLLVITMWTCFAIEQSAGNWNNISVFYTYSVLKSLSILRLFRFLRLVKHYSGLKILSMTILTSKRELFLLSLTILLTATVFASFIYYAEFYEPTTFRHIFVGIWWAIVTMTTIGYGDMYPKSGPGYVVGVVCALFGLLIIAMPLAIIASNFNDIYSRNNERKKLKKLKAKYNIK